MTDISRREDPVIELTGAPSRPAPLTYAEFEMMLRNVLPNAFGMAVRLTANRQDAEDLLQEASLAALRGLGTFAAGSNFKAWFYRILVNCFYAAHRKHRPTASLEDVEDSYAGYLYDRSADAGLLAAPDPVQATIGRIATEDVAAALGALPDEYRIVCTMYFMDDLTYEEIAAMLGIPLGTVRSRLHRGRRMLQKRLWALAVDQGIVPAAGTTSPTDEAS